MIEIRECDNMSPERGLPSLSDESVDALVTDPPAGIGFMGKSWDADRGGRAAWVAWLASALAQCRRVLKPGGHGFVWALPRTSHWTGWAVEDAGLEVREVVTHIFGQGWAKGLDVSRAIDEWHGVERERGPVDPARAGRLVNQTGDYQTDAGWSAGHRRVTSDPPATEDAKRWHDWRTELKPTSEHWILVRRPLEGTVVENVLAHGVGALNVGACRVPSGERPLIEMDRRPIGGASYAGARDGSTTGSRAAGTTTEGRFPPTVLLTHAADCGDARCVPWCPVEIMDAQAGHLKSGAGAFKRASGVGYKGGAYGEESRPEGAEMRSYGDEGGPSRFFPIFRYEGKPGAGERDLGAEGVIDDEGRAGNTHPTVKSVALMRWLCRLVTPPGGLVLDPFAGSGTTGIACHEERFRFLGMEQDAHHAAIARARIAAATAQQLMPW